VIVVTGRRPLFIGQRVTIDYDHLGNRLETPQPAVIVKQATLAEYASQPGKPMEPELLSSHGFDYFYWASTD